MGRIILAVVVAMIAAVAVITIVQMMTQLVYPTPASDVMTDPAKLQAWMAAMPLSAYVIVLISYFLGAFAGGFIVKNMSRRESPGMTLPIVIGGVLTVGAILNFFVLLPGQPLWFVIVGLLIFIPVSLFGAKFAGR